MDQARRLLAAYVAVTEGVADGVVGAGLGAFGATGALGIVPPSPGTRFW
jgi:hypothetical protein